MTTTNYVRSGYKKLISTLVPTREFFHDGTPQSRQAAERAADEFHADVIADRERRAGRPLSHRELVFGLAPPPEGPRSLAPQIGEPVNPYDKILADLQSKYAGPGEKHLRAEMIKKALEQRDRWNADRQVEAERQAKLETPEYQAALERGNERLGYLETCGFASDADVAAQKNNLDALKQTGDLDTFRDRDQTARKALTDRLTVRQAQARQEAEAQLASEGQAEPPATPIGSDRELVQHAMKVAGVDPQ